MKGASPRASSERADVWRQRAIFFAFVVTVALGLFATQRLGVVNDAAAGSAVRKPRIVISARPPFYWGLGPGGSYGPGPAWYRETHPALFCWYGPCWSGPPARR